MLNTENLLSFMDCFPIWLIKIKVKFTVYEKIFLTASLMFFITELTLLTSYEVNSIGSVVQTVSYTSGVPSAMVCIWYIWFKNKDPLVSLQEFESFDTDVRFESLKSFDIFIILGVVTSLLWWSITFLYAFFLSGISPMVLTTIYAWGIVNEFQSQVLALKYLILKRFNFIGQRLHGEHILDAISFIRRLVNINDKINTFYSLIATCSLSFFFMNFIEISAWTWLTFGLKRELAGLDKIYGNLLVVFFSFRTLVMTSACAIVNNKTSELQVEVDRSICNGQRCLLIKKQLFVFSLELYHYSLEFTGMELFSVDLDSATAACGQVISFMMVFIQFM